MEIAPMAFYMPPARPTKQPLPLGGRDYTPEEEDPSWIKLHALHVNVTGLYDPREDHDLSAPVGEPSDGRTSAEPGSLNRRAVLALICGLLAVPALAVVLGGLLLGGAAVVLGLPALDETIHTGQRGYGLASAAVVLGLLCAILSLLGLLFRS